MPHSRRVLTPSPSTSAHLDRAPAAADGARVRGAHRCLGPPPLTARQEPEPSSQSADRERVERLSQRASERVQALQAEADELASRQRTLLEEMRRLELDRQIKTTELNTIDHGDQAFSLYGYLGELAVHTGVRVDERTLIGSTGLSPTGSQAMYFELRVDGRPVDPLEWLQ